MCKKSHQHQSGNVLFIILIAVALFAALSFAVTQSGRSGIDDGSAEKAELDQAVIDNYLACINAGTMKLQIIRGCTTFNYDPPADWGNENKDCHIFHPEGAGCSYQELGLDVCIETEESKELDIGEQCGSIIYAGESGGNREFIRQRQIRERHHGIMGQETDQLLV